MNSPKDPIISSQPSILIVEDEEGPRESLRMVLSSSYNLYSVDSAEVGLQILKEHPIDLVTLDLKLPGRQGMDLLQEIREEGRDVEVIIITGYGTLQSAMDAIHQGVSAYILKPFNVEDLRAMIAKTLERRGRVQSLQHTLKAFNSLWAGNGDPTTLFSNIKTLLEATNPALANHAKRVNNYAVILADHLNFSGEARDSLQLGAFLHDIGNINIQDRVSLGPIQSQDQTQDLTKCHPTIGERMLKDLPFPLEVREIIRHHHERYDGTGFPDGLSGENIPFGARIVGIANFFDNLVTGETEHGSLALPEARECIRREAGHRLDPDLAELFPRVIW
jgi:putative nucleotidyltransferase with HDIG domain